MTRSVAIIHGLAEGPWHSRKLRQALVAAGYEVINNAAKADVIIAHSGGGLIIPTDYRAQLVILVGFPWHPERSMRHRLIEKQQKDYKAHSEKKRRRYWAVKSFYHCTYFIRYFLDAWRMRRHDHIPGGNGKVMFIRNESDVMSDKSAILKLVKKNGWEFIELPGEHDDVWENPEAYCDLINLH